jgi:glycosyltransferase involved in cell wall biosynthesis
MQKKCASPFVSVVVRTRNRKDDLEKCINSILGSTYGNYEVIVVNDDSEDGTTAFLSANYSLHEKVRFLTVKGKKSTAHLYNIGVEHSKGEIIAFVDDDCIVERSWLGAIVDPFVLDKRIMAAGDCRISGAASTFTRREESAAAIWRSGGRRSSASPLTQGLSIHIFTTSSI